MLTLRGMDASDDGPAQAHTCSHQVRCRARWAALQRNKLLRKRGGEIERRRSVLEGGTFATDNEAACLASDWDADRVTETLAAACLKPLIHATGTLGVLRLKHRPAAPRAQQGLMRCWLAV